MSKFTNSLFSPGKMIIWVGKMFLPDENQSFVHSDPVHLEQCNVQVHKYNYTVV